MNLIIYCAVVCYGLFRIMKYKQQVTITCIISYSLPRSRDRRYEAPATFMYRIIGIGGAGGSLTPGVLKFPVSCGASEVIPSCKPADKD